MKEVNVKHRRTRIYWVAFRDKKVVGVAPRQESLKKWKHDHEETYFIREKDIPKIKRPSEYYAYIDDPFVRFKEREVPIVRRKHNYVPSHEGGEIESYVHLYLDKECTEIIKKVDERQDFIRAAIKERYARILREYEEKKSRYTY